MLLDLFLAIEIGIVHLKKPRKNLLTFLIIYSREIHVNIAWCNMDVDLWILTLTIVEIECLSCLRFFRLSKWVERNQNYLIYLMKKLSDDVRTILNRNKHLLNIANLCWHFRLSKFTSWYVIVPIPFLYGWFFLV